MSVVISNGYQLSASYSTEAWKPVVLWQSVLDTSSIAAGTEADGYPATNLLTPATGDLWKATNTSDVYLTMTSINGDYTSAIGMARHNFGTDQVGYLVEEKEGAGDSWVEVLSEQTPAIDDDSPILIRLERKIRYGLRVKLNPGSVVPELGILMVGDLLVFDKGIPPGHTPINYGWKRQRTDSVAINGDYLGGVTVTSGLETSIQQVDLDPDWYRENMEPFRKNAETFFWAWSPLAYPEEVGYCWFINDPQPVVSQKTGNINITFQVAGIDV